MNITYEYIHKYLWIYNEYNDNAFMKNGKTKYILLLDL